MDGMPVHDRKTERLIDTERERATTQKIFDHLSFLSAPCSRGKRHDCISGERKRRGWKERKSTRRKKEISFLLLPGYRKEGGNAMRDCSEDAADELQRREILKRVRREQEKRIEQKKGW